MITRSYVKYHEIALQGLLELQHNIEKTINIIDLYYSEYLNKSYIVQICLTDEELYKIKNKRIIIYKNENYDTAEMLGYKKVSFDLNLKNNLNKNNQHIIKSIQEDLLDDVTIDMLSDDKDIEVSNILISIKN